MIEMTETKTSGTLARRLYGLTEPIAMVPYAAPEPTAEVMALGYRNYWGHLLRRARRPAGPVPGRGGARALL
jgi:hypothetical protein